ncbi:FimV/HubP family polar landmark protein [Piscirickettsia salmonis]|uniref:FimV/HubP family polar landmark protein n=1 Tax=Piscirickettsia salmonis TaxID=1238 RepID=UPI003A7F8A4F
MKIIISAIIFLSAVLLGNTVFAKRYGPVQEKETLWSIAKAHRPIGMSIPKMMQAIVRLNPQAFNHNDPATLKKGAILKLPSIAQVKRVQPQPKVQSRQVASPVKAKPEVTTVIVPSKPQKVLIEKKVSYIPTDKPRQIDNELKKQLSYITQQMSALTRSVEEVQEEMLSVARDVQQTSNGVLQLEEYQQQLQRTEQERIARQEAAERVQSKQNEIVEIPVELGVHNVVTPAESSLDQPPKASESRIAHYLQGTIFDWLLLGFILVALIPLVMLKRYLRDRKLTEKMTPLSKAKTKAKKASNVKSLSERKEPVVQSVLKKETAAVAMSSMVEDVNTKSKSAAHPALQGKGFADPISVGYLVAMSKQQYPEAESLLKKAIAERPSELELKLKLLEVYAMMQQKTEFERLAKACVDNPAGHDRDILTAQIDNIRHSTWGVKAAVADNATISLGDVAQELKTAETAGASELVDTELTAPEGETPEGETPEGETPEAETPEGETPEAETPEAETPEGETPEGEIPEGETPEGETPEGETPEGETPEGETPEGETPEGETPEGETPEGETPEGETPEGETPEGETPEGETPEGETPEGETPEGETPEGETPEGETPEGETPEGETPEGETPEGETPEAETPEAETPEGETPEAETPEAETPEAETPEAETPEGETSEAETPEAETPEGESAEITEESEKEGTVNLNVSVRGGGEHQDVQSVSLEEGDEATLTMGDSETEVALDDIRLEEDSEEEGVGADVDILAGDNEISAQLDAARAYILAEDVDSARKVLRDVLKQGDSTQQDEARQLLTELDQTEEAST